MINVRFFYAALDKNVHTCTSKSFNLLMMKLRLGPIFKMAIDCSWFLLNGLSLQKYSVRLTRDEVYALSNNTLHMHYQIYTHIKAFIDVLSICFFHDF